MQVNHETLDGLLDFLVENCGTRGVLLGLSRVLETRAVPTGPHSAYWLNASHEAAELARRYSVRADERKG